MTQILIHGRKGSGKTLLAVQHAYEAYLEKRVVYSNIKLNFPHKALTQDMIKDIMKQEYLHDAFLLIDELHTITDSRRSMRKHNIDWGYFFTQSRKRDVDLVATTQFIGQVDVRYRNNCDYLIECNKIFLRGKHLRRFVIANKWWRPDGELVYTKLLKEPHVYYKLYDTNELVYYDWRVDQGDKK